MHIELFRDENIPITLSTAFAGRNPDILLQGSILRSHHSAFSSLFLQEYETASCLIYYGYAQSHMDHEIHFKERPDGIRLIGVMKQAIKLQERNTIAIKPGQFILLAGQEQTVRIFFEKGKEYRVLSCYYSQDILYKLGIEHGSIKYKEKPRAFTPAMSAIILEMFAAYYEAELLNFFYENKVREVWVRALGY